MISSYALISAIVLAGSAEAVLQQKPEAEIYAVLRGSGYHAVLGSTLLMTDRAIAIQPLSGSSADWLRQFDEMPDSLRRALRKPPVPNPGPFDPALFPAATRMVSSARIDAFFIRRNPSAWDGFEKEFGARGWLSFSDVLFTPDRLDAVVYYEASCGGLCGERGYAWLHRDNGQSRWVLKKQIVRSMA